MASDTLLVVSGMAFEARMAQGDGVRTVYGLDTVKLTHAIETAIQNGAKAILSFGTAAGLLPSLHAGAIVVASEIRSRQGALLCDANWTAEIIRALPEALSATIAGVDAPITSAQEKAALYAATNAAAADMESHHAALLAQKYGLPFAAIRVVLDDAETALPPAALAAPTREGGIHYGKLIGSLLVNPRQLPALMRLAADQAKAKPSLLRCGHLLKSGRFGLVHLGS